MLVTRVAYSFIIAVGNCETKKDFISCEMRHTGAWISFYNVLLVVINIYSCTKPSIVGVLEEAAKELSHVSCKSTKVEHIMKLREKKSTDQLIVCLTKALQTSNDAFLWSLTGESFQLQGKTKTANVFFKEGIKRGGKLSKFIKKWHFIGPFVIGKAEVDGDPLAEWGGVQNVSTLRWDKKVFQYSELVASGVVRWTEIIQHSSTEPVNITPYVDWNELVMSLQSMGITEWQGWIMGDFYVNEEEAMIGVQCLGVHTVYVDDVILTGDVYRRDQFW